MPRQEKHLYKLHFMLIGGENHNIIYFKRGNVFIFS